MNAPASPQPSGRLSRRAILLPALAIVVLALAAWSNTFRAPFELDDDASIVANPSIRNLASFRWLTPPAARGETVGGRPLLNLSLALDYATGGLDVRCYHASNLAIHVAAALVLFGLIRRSLALTPGWSSQPEVALGVAFVAAAVWAVHPLTTQAVTYVVQRAESLMALFYLATLYGFARAYAPAASECSADVRAEACRRRWQAFAVACCALGMATKENMVSAPLAVLLFDRAFVGGSFREAWRRRSGFHLALAGTWMILGLLLASTGGDRGGSVGFDVQAGWGAYVLTQFPALVRYTALCFWPHPLVFEYGAFTVPGLGSVAAPALFVSVMLLATAYALWRAPRAGFVVATAGMVLAPTSLVPGTLQMIVEHRMYLPLAGAVVLVVSALARLVRGRPAAIAAVVCAVTALAILTYARNATYRSSLALWWDTAGKAPENPRAHNNLGVALQAAGHTADAVAEYRRAIALQPNHAFARANLGNVLLSRRRWAEAAEQFSEALVADPHLVSARANLAVALTQLGRTKEAVAQYRAALADDPEASDVRTNYAGLLVDQGRVGEAAPLLRQVLATAPGLAEAHYHLGRALERQGSGDAADAEYRQALRLKPRFAEAHLALGNRRLAAGDAAAAEQEYRRAAELDPRYAEPRYALGNLRAHAGQFPAAITEFRAALELDPEHVAARNNLANCQLMTGDLAGAIANYERVLRVRPDDQSVRRNLSLARELQQAAQR